MLDKRAFESIAAQGGRQLGAQGGEAARAAFFMDMLAKWLWDQKSQYLEITGNGVNIHLIDECATTFCEYLAECGDGGYRHEENPERFLPKLRYMGRDRKKMYIC
jgi:hypothetical protein